MHILPKLQDDTPFLNRLGIYRFDGDNAVAFCLQYSSIPAWMPIIGTIIGLAKLALIALAAAIDGVDNPKLVLAFTARSCVEALSLGFILIIPDIAITIIRSIAQNIEEAQPRGRIIHPFNRA